MAEIGRPRTRPGLPVVLSREDVAQIFCFLDGEQSHTMLDN